MAMQLQEITILIPPYLKKFCLRNFKTSSQGHIYYCGKKIVENTIYVPRRFEKTEPLKVIVDSQIKPISLQQHFCKEFDKIFCLWFMFEKHKTQAPNIQLVCQFMQKHDITEEEINVDSLLRKWQRAKNKDLTQLIMN
jgi:hypothetical protein